MSAEAIDKGIGLTNREELVSHLSDTGWNWLAHNFFVQLAVNMAFAVGIMRLISGAVKRYLDPSILLNDTFFNTTLGAVVVTTSVLIFIVMPKVYPELVIQYGKKSSGRVMKDDILWFITVLLLPYFLGLILR